MPKRRIHPFALTLLSTLLAAGCASGPAHDGHTVGQRQCPGNYMLKCTKRSAQPEECSCVPRGHIEETVEALIGVP